MNTNNISFQCTLIAGVVAASVLASHVSAANRTWTGATNDSWGTTTNWSPNGTPGSADDLYFTSASTANLHTTLGATNYTVKTIRADSTLANDVSIGASGGTLGITSSIAWWSGVTKNLSITAPVVTSGGTHAWWLDPTGSVDISGPVTLGAGLYVRGNTAKTGAGTYTFSDDVTVSSSGWIQIADSYYHGKVAITNGTFDATAAAAGTIIGQTGGTGTLTVSGGTFKAPNVSSLIIGNASGSGTLTINGTGVVEAATQNVVVGRGGNGVGTLNLDGGTLLTSRSVRGSEFSSGNGTVNFNGGTLKARDSDNANWLLSASTFNVYVKGSNTTDGAVFDTNGYNMGIPVALQHDASGPAIDGGVTKNGNGTLTLTNVSNTYTGATSVNGGTLALVNAGSSNNIASSSSINLGANTILDVTGLSGGGLVLASGQTLQGTGTLMGDLNVASGSIIAPGASPGTMFQVGNQTWSDGGTFSFDIDNANATAGDDVGWSLLDITGNLDVSGLTPGGLTIDIDSLLHPSHATGELDVVGSSEYVWDFAHTTDGIVGFDPGLFSFNTDDFTSSVAGSFSIQQTGNNLELVFTTVPEPASIAIWSILGMLGLGFGIWRRRMGE